MIKKKEKNETSNMEMDMDGLIKEPTSRFIRVRCSKCKNEQIVFGKSSTKVTCLVCGTVLSLPTGGMTKMKARVLEVLE